MAVTKITADFIDADAIETTQIKDANVTTAKIADNAVTLAKMVGGTDGELITFDSSGNPAYVAVGTAGEVLTSGGVGVAPTMRYTGVVQAVHAGSGAVATGTTIMPIDNTIPAITEGDEYMTVSITPKSATNRLVIDISAHFGSNTAGNLGLALFQDTTSAALSAATVFLATDHTNQIVLCHEMVAGTTSSTTFRARAGLSASGTLTFNGHTGGREMGGVMASSIRVTEYGVG